MTWIAVIILLVGLYVGVLVSDRYRRRDADPLRERLDELAERLAHALPEGDPYRTKILIDVQPLTRRVYCHDCRFKGQSDDSSAICLAHPSKGKYLVLGGQLNKNYDCDHFQKKTP